MKSHTRKFPDFKLCHLALLVFACSGCAGKLFDISKEASYCQQMGVSYRTKSDFVLYKIKDMADPKRYVFTSDVSPSFKFTHGITPVFGGVGGPEYVPYLNLPLGTIVEVTKITADRWLFISNEYFWVRFRIDSGSNSFIEAMVLDPESYNYKDGQKNFSLSPVNFERLK